MQGPSPANNGEAFLVQEPDKGGCAPSVLIAAFLLRRDLADNSNDVLVPDLEKAFRPALATSMLRRDQAATMAGVAIMPKARLESPLA